MPKTIMAEGFGHLVSIHRGVQEDAVYLFPRDAMFEEHPPKVSQNSGLKGTDLFPGNILTVG